MASFEVLSSLGNIYYNNLEWVFFVIINGVVVEVEELGYFLLYCDKWVCNDIYLFINGYIKFIMGLNMVGKSIFLRMVGLNMVFVMAGVLVCVCSMAFLFLQVYMSMCIQDVFQESIFFFYVEFKCLKFIIEAVEDIVDYQLLKL